MRLAITLLLTAFLFPAPDAGAQEARDRLYGRVVTDDGETYQGLIRWDKNEAGWVDLLNGSRTIEQSTPARRQIKLFGIEIAYENDTPRTTRESGIRFGHIERIEPTGRDRARLTLRSGETIELKGGSTDIGRDMRAFVVEDERHGVVDLEWKDLDHVTFMPSPAELASRDGMRLYGTLRTRSGQTFTGYVCWDVDEVMEADVLDGEDERGRDHEIRFGDILSLERESRRSTRVLLRKGGEVVLSGTNDVNSSNRGILIMDPYLGQVRVDWDAFDRLDLGRPDHAISYQEFHGGGHLRGAVYTRDGERYEGLIRWDDDEEYAWELLDGEADDVDFDVEFGLIAEIARSSDRAAEVLLRDGRRFILSGSNDVNEDNDGIIITEKDGESVRVDWDDFDRVVFAKP